MLAPPGMPKMTSTPSCSRALRTASAPFIVIPVPLWRCLRRRPRPPASRRAQPAPDRHVPMARRLPISSSTGGSSSHCLHPVSASTGCGARKSAPTWRDERVRAAVRRRQQDPTGPDRILQGFCRSIMATINSPDRRFGTNTEAEWYVSAPARRRQMTRRVGGFAWLRWRTRRPSNQAPKNAASSSASIAPQ